MFDDVCHTILILGENLLILIVEGCMEAVDDRHLAVLGILVVRFQQYGTESRREGQGIDSRDEDGHSHRHTELTIERTTRTAEERHRHKHRRHHEGDGDDGTRNLVHGVDTCRQRTLVALVELGVDSLHNHNGVVHHNGNSQEHGGENEEVDGETEDPEEEERTYQCHRNGNHRDERRTEVLEEDIYHHEHEQQRDYQGEDNLLDRCEKELRNVVVDLIYHAWRERPRLILKFCLHVLGNLSGVGSCNLLYHTHDGRITIVFHRHAIYESAKFHLSHVFQSESLTVLVA